MKENATSTLVFIQIKVEGAGDMVKARLFFGFPQM